MQLKKLLTISQFAKVSDLPRDTLLYYDEIGLLSPVERTESKYRKYTSDQLPEVHFIHTLQACGLSLREIQEIRHTRSPEAMVRLFERQAEEAERRIQKETALQKLLWTLRDTINAATGVEETKVEIRALPVKAMVLGELNDYSQGQDAYDALSAFYEDCARKYPGMSLNFPVWGVFSRERVLGRDPMLPDRYYFANPDGRDKRPAGLYAVGYARGAYGANKGLYEKMLTHIAQSGHEVTGDAYEEYPLNEICLVDENEYLMRLLIAVGRKDGATSDGGAEP